MNGFVAGCVQSISCVGRKWKVMRTIPVGVSMNVEC
jgi:hypothetical protein